MGSNTKHTSFHKIDLSSTPEFHVWLNLGNKIRLVKVKEKLWFCLNVNKCAVLEEKATIFP